LFARPDSRSNPANKQPSQDILDHQAKRKVELKLMEFRLAMEVKRPRTSPRTIRL